MIKNISFIKLFLTWVSDKLNGKNKKIKQLEEKTERLERDLQSLKSLVSGSIKITNNNMESIGFALNLLNELQDGRNAITLSREHKEDMTVLKNTYRG